MIYYTDCEDNYFTRQKEKSNFLLECLNAYDVYDFSEIVYYCIQQRVKTTTFPLVFFFK